MTKQRWSAAANRKSKPRPRDAIRAKTKRANGHGMAGGIIGVNRTLRGWCAYFKHRRHTTLPQLDRWARTRLRSILRTPSPSRP